MGSSLQSIGMLVGATLCGLVTLQVVAWLGSSWWSAARRRRDDQWRRDEFRRQMQVAIRKAHARHSQAAWEGYRPYRVAAIVDEAIDVKSFYLTPADGTRPPLFEPGQYLTFQLQPPGREKSVVRCYSLSDRHHDDYYRVTVKRLSAPATAPQVPDGTGSTFFHRMVRVGDFLQVQAPRGRFFLDPMTSNPVVLIGGGIGMTPLVSMLNTIVHSGQPRQVYFVLSVRNGQEHPFKEHLRAVGHRHPRVHMHISYSCPRPEDKVGEDYQAAGRITMERLRQVLPSNNFDFYVCGPAEMMEWLVPALIDWGVPPEHVNYEAFGPSSVKCTQSKRAGHPPTVQPCEVRFARSGTSFTWDGSQDSLLEFAEAHGIPMDFGCRAGNCGQCLTAITSGTVETIKRSGMPVDADHCLTCISVPAGPLVLDT